MESDLPPEQKQYLFNDKWRFEVDESFSLLLLSAEPHFPLLLADNKKDVYSLFTLSADMLTTQFGTSFTATECEHRFQHFRERHRVMREIITKYGINYCCESGLMWGPKEAWKRVFTDEPLSLAYETMGDPQWAKLQILFGTVDKKTVHPAVLASNHSTTVDEPMDLKGKKPLW